MNLAPYRLYAEIAAVILLLVGFACYRHSLIVEGEQRIEAVDAKAAIDQRVAVAAQKAEDAQRIKDAEDGYEKERAANALARTTEPVSHVVCFAPRADRVPAHAAVSNSQTAAAGVLPPAGASDPETFDPGPELDQLHDEADDAIAACRRLDSSVRR